MKHFLLFLAGLFLIGCVQSDLSLSEDNLVDNQLEASYYEDEVLVPDMTVIGPVLVDSLPFYFEERCVCEWDMWRESGLLCLGIVCSNACPREYAECREVRRACVPR